MLMTCFDENSCPTFSILGLLWFLAWRLHYWDLLTSGVGLYVLHTCGPRSPSCASPYILPAVRVIYIVRSTQYDPTALTHPALSLRRFIGSVSFNSRNLTFSTRNGLHPSFGMDRTSQHLCNCHSPHSRIRTATLVC